MKKFFKSLLISAGYIAIHFACMVFIFFSSTVFSILSSIKYNYSLSYQDFNN